MKKFFVIKSQPAIVACYGRLWH